MRVSGLHKPESIEIHCRTMVYAFDQQIPRYWAKGNPVITAFYNALSTVIPEGERFFIQSVREAGEQIDDGALKKDIQGFIEQEASHSIGHRALNNWIKSHGYPVEGSLGYAKKLLAYANKHFSLKHRLAMTAAIEHFSSVMSDRFLRYAAINEALDPVVRDFLMWHCVEEIEHKAVAYDLYQLIYGGYYTRLVQMLFITLFFVPSVFAVQFRYLHQDKQLYNFRAWGEAIRYFWLTPGWFSKIPSGYIRYFSSRFHPWDENNQDVVDEWIEMHSAAVSH